VVPDPPQLEAAEFSESGAQVHVIFDSRTDQAGKAASDLFVCVEVLSFADADKADCYWVNTTHIEATVSSSPNFLPGSTVTLDANTTKAACQPDTRCDCYAFANESNVTAIAVSTVVPNIVFQGPTSTSVCESLEISAEQSTGSGGREMTFLWDAYMQDVGDAEIAGTLDMMVDQSQFSTEFRATSDQLTSLLDSGGTSLVVTLNLTNFFGETSSSHKIVELTSNNVPTLQLVGGTSQSLTRAETLLVIAEAYATNCDERTAADRSVDLTWTLYEVTADTSELTDINSTSKNALHFLLDPYTLGASTEYQLQAIAIDSATDLTNEVVADIIVEQGEVVAVITGGSDRTASVDELVTISAADSRDEDVPNSEDPGLVFSWECSSQNVSDADGVDCLDAVTIEDSELTIPEGALDAGTYDFTVMVTDTDELRISTASVSLQLVPTTPPNVEIVTSLSSVRSKAKVTIEAEVSWPHATTGSASNTSITSSWSLVEGELALGRTLADAARTSLSITRQVSDTTLYRHDLVLRANSLVAGGQYAFQLIADANSDFGYSTIEFSVSTPPSSGRLSIVPSSGRAFFDTFELRALNWVGDSLPLKYRFETENDVILRAASLDNVLVDARLPKSNNPPNLTVTVVVIDSVDAEASASKDVYIVNASTADDANNDGSDSLANVTDEALDAAFANYSLDSVCQIVTASASAAEGDSEVLDTLVAALDKSWMELADEDLETTEQVIASLVAPTNDANSLMLETAQEALDLAQQTASVLTKEGLGDTTSSTPDNMAQILSNLLDTDLFRNVESNATATLLSTIDEVTLAQRDTLVENEDSIGFTSTNLRSASRRVSSADGSETHTIEYEEMDASANITAEDGATYDASLTEFEVNPHSTDDAQSQVVRFELDLDDPTGTIENSTVDLNIPGTEPLTNTTEQTNITVICKCGDTEPQDVTCPDGSVFQVECDGKYQEKTFLCPTEEYACATWNSELHEWLVPEYCIQVVTMDGQTTCRCILPRTDEGIVDDYTTVTELGSGSLEDANDLFGATPDWKRSQFVVYAFGALLIVVVCAMFLGRELDRRSRAKISKNKRSRILQRMRTLSWIGPALPMLHAEQADGHSQHSSSRLLRIMTRRHPFLNFVNVYSPSVPRSFRALKLGVEVAIFFFTLGLETWLEFPDIDCDKEKTEQDCEKTRSRFTRRRLCRWHACSQECYEDNVGSSATEHFIVLVVVLALIVPVVTIVDWIFVRYLIAPCPEPLQRLGCCAEPSGATPTQFVPDPLEETEEGTGAGEESKHDNDPLDVVDSPSPRPRGGLNQQMSSFYDDDSALVFPDDDEADDDEADGHVVSERPQGQQSAQGVSVMDVEVNEVNFIPRERAGQRRVRYAELVQQKAADNALANDDDEIPNQSRTDLPWLVEQCEDVMKLREANPSYIDKIRQKQIKTLRRSASTVGKAISVSFRAVASSRRLLDRRRCSSCCLSETRREQRHHQKYIERLTREVRHAILLRQAELRACIDAVESSGAEKRVVRRAVERLRRLEAKMMDEWRWVPSRRIWEANIEEKIRDHIDEAFRVKEELDAIEGADEDETRALRQSKLVECEKTAYLSSTERMIYRRAMERALWQVAAPKDPPHLVPYLCAWLFIVCLIGYIVIFSTQLSTIVGRGESKLWLTRVVLTIFLFYFVIEPLEILWFDWFLPGLLSERMRKIHDPTKIRRFPYETRVPETPLWYLVVMCPDEYSETKIGAYALRGSIGESDVSWSSRSAEEFYEKDLDAIYQDATYKPRLGTRVGLVFSALLLHIPDGLHEIVFEELLLGIILSSNLLANLPSWFGDSDGEQSESLAMAVVIVTFLIIACLFGCLMAMCNVLEHLCIEASARRRRGSGNHAP